MDVHDVREFVFEALADPVACLGCVGPPECKHECEPGPKYSTGLATINGVIELEIDGQVYEVCVTHKGPVIG
jgi:hypothetical protein